MTIEECNAALKGAAKTIQAVAEGAASHEMTHRDARTGYLSAIAVALLVMAECAVDARRSNE